MTTDIHEVLHKIEELKNMVEELDSPEIRRVYRGSMVVPSPLKPGTY